MVKRTSLTYITRIMVKRTSLTYNTRIMVKRTSFVVVLQSVMACLFVLLSYSTSLPLVTPGDTHHIQSWHFSLRTEAESPAPNKAQLASKASLMNIIPSNCTVLLVFWVADDDYSSIINSLPPLCVCFQLITFPYGINIKWHDSRISSQDGIIQLEGHELLSNSFAYIYI